jgi:hypothetical protein
MLKNVGRSMAVLVAVLFALPVEAQRTTYFKFIINGDSASVTTQGDTMAWECDCGLGDTLNGEFWLDLNGNHVVDGIDKEFLHSPMTLIDGNTNWEGGPADSSSVLDGIFHADLGNMFSSFGLAPTHYVFQITNLNDSSVAENWMLVNPPVSPEVTVSGTVTIEGITPPDSLLHAIWVTTNMEEGIWWSAITDSSGAYTLNLPDTGTYSIGADDDISPYVRPWYVEIHVVRDTSGIDFLYTLPTAYVYGTVKDDRDSSLSSEVLVHWQNETLETQGYLFTADTFWFGLQAGEIKVALSGDYLIPDYLVPESQEFMLNDQDSLEKNFTCYRTDASIFGLVTEDGGVPSKSYLFRAESQSIGWTESRSDSLTGLFELRVNSTGKVSYSVQLDEYETPLPVGLGFADGNGWTVDPGDTVFVRLVSYKGSVSGSLYVETGDPIPDFTDFTAIATRNNPWEMGGQVQVNSNGTYKLYVPEEIWDIGIWGPDEWPYMPTQIEGVVVDTVDVPGNDFMVNYGHCTLSGHLYGLDSIPAWFNIGAGGDGGWPDGYQQWGDVNGDSSYSLRICEGDWHVQAPLGDGWDTLYTVSPIDTSFSVTEADSSVVVDFYYTLGIQEVDVPLTTMLYCVAPNPSVGNMKIRYSVARKSDVVIGIYDATGRLVRSLVDTEKKPGVYASTWDGKSTNGDRLANGIYFCHFFVKGGETGAVKSTKKMVLVR